MPTRRGLLRSFSPILGCVLCVAGCANTYIQPDTNPSLRGPRFYIPRPYIVVLRPFPIAENSWVLPGKVASDGLIVAVSALEKTPLKEYVFTDAGARTDAPFLKFPSATLAEGAPEIGATSGDKEGGLADMLGDERFNKLMDQVIDAGAEVDTEGAPTGGTASAWIKKGDITELRDPVNDLFEIRYLPDMSQRYVLVGEAGLGTSKIDAYLTRGWLAHHYGHEIDRSELGRMVFGNIQAVLDIARAAGKTALIASTGGLGAIPVGAAEIGATSGERAVPGGARDVLLRFTVIELAVPGVYPILRLEEMREYTDGTTGQKYYELPISGSFQQPASPALPVGYRTTKILIVSAVRDGENPTAEYRAKDGKDQTRTGDDLRSAVEGFLAEALSASGIPSDEVTVAMQELDPPDGSIELVVTVGKGETFSGDDDLWMKFLETLGLKLANKETFPEAEKVQLKRADVP